MSYNSASVSVKLHGDLSLTASGLEAPRVPTGLELAVPLEAKPHTPVYTMHKYFARRPWNVFSQLVSHYSSPGEIVLDPFCGGGTTVVESLKLRRRAIGVDLNRVATYITEMECQSVDIESLKNAYVHVIEKASHDVMSLYSTRCEHCGSFAAADWIQWDERYHKIINLKYRCSRCGFARQRPPNKADISLAQDIEEEFPRYIKRKKLWFPKTRIPHGDKTDSLLHHSVKHYFELFTPRNLLALSILLRSIEDVSNQKTRKFLKFAFSGSLKWASRQSHLRGKIVEGWAIHGYWIYPRSLEINVWKIFEKRVLAVIKGKTYSEEHLGNFCKLTMRFRDLEEGKAQCMIVNRSSAKLPLPNESVDSIITDPPYGSNVNYAELSDFWSVWINQGQTLAKREEVVINRTQHKSLTQYEDLLFSIFRECYRVLKPSRYIVCTFNSKDLRVVTSFIAAVSRAGFVLHPDGLLYQKPIRAYTTTFHAMQIGAFVGDFVFAFHKTKMPKAPMWKSESERSQKLRDISLLIERATKNQMTEIQVREKAYSILIPFVAKYARLSMPVYEDVVELFENKMREQNPHFRSVREQITEIRRRTFLRSR
jgi:DNA modification methylase